MRSWDDMSIEAGAVAVKGFGLSMYQRRGYVWDCNWSQVYYPQHRTERSDKAVDDTWDWIVLNGDDVATTYYDDYPYACSTRGHECMSQYASHDDALAGMSWKEILTKYYPNYTLVNINGGN